MNSSLDVVFRHYEKAFDIIGISRLSAYASLGNKRQMIKKKKEEEMMGKTKEEEMMRKTKEEEEESGQLL